MSLGTLYFTPLPPIAERPPPYGDSFVRVPKSDVTGQLHDFRVYRVNNTSGCAPIVRTQTHIWPTERIDFTMKKQTTPASQRQNLEKTLKLRMFNDKTLIALYMAVSCGAKTELGI